MRDPVLVDRLQFALAATFHYLYLSPDEGGGVTGGVGAGRNRDLGSSPGSDSLAAVRSSACRTFLSRTDPAD